MFCFHILIGVTGKGTSSLLVEVFTVYLATPSLGPWALGMAGLVGHVPIISEEHWVVVGCNLVDYGHVLGVGAEGRENNSPGSQSYRAL